MRGRGPVLPQTQAPGRQQALNHSESADIGEVLVLWGVQRVKERELGCGKRFLSTLRGWSDPGGGRTQPVRVRRDVWPGLADSTLLKGRVGSWRLLGAAWAAGSAPSGTYSCHLEFSAPASLSLALNTSRRPQVEGEGGSTLLGSRRDRELGLDRKVGGKRRKAGDTTREPQEKVSSTQVQHIREPEGTPGPHTNSNEDL